MTTNEKIERCENRIAKLQKEIEALEEKKSNLQAKGKWSSILNFEIDSRKTKLGREKKTLARLQSEEAGTKKEETINDDGYGTCPHCLRKIRLTKHGRIYNHGWMLGIKASCKGGGYAPLEVLGKRI